MKIAVPSLLALAIALAVASPIQEPFQVNAWNDTIIDTKPNKLHGRFLHITDMHPDPYYTYRASTSKSCHGKKAKKKSRRANYWGTPTVECDSPLVLTNFTLDYLERNWADQVDFVIWTGDNARHDNDHKIPRTPREIFDLNRQVATRMEKIFLKRGVPVVPSLGNNDIWPHNIMTPGPNSITEAFASIWSSFVPFAQRRVFERGAYYSVEVIPRRVAVISLNSMYFYDSNKAVNGCPYHDRKDAGNLELDWLEVQLKMYRDRSMQVYLTGHVPPSPGMYFPECYVRYAELSLRFQDTILGHLHGHMNMDFFLFMEEVDLEIIPEKENLNMNVTGTHDGLFETLMAEFAHLPREGDEEKLDGLAVVNVAPSVVPNPFVPGFRVFSYNATEGRVGTKGKRDHSHRRGRRGDKKQACKKEPHRSSWKCHLDEPWFSDPDAPSRKNQALTPLGYAQYYMPDIGKAGRRDGPEFRLEYVTYKSGDGVGSREAPYGMEDLTVASWVGLGRELGSGDGEVRRRFHEYMFVSM
ncbi:Endopolyphosphatase [Leucoagaricus gongylophorus]